MYLKHIRYLKLKKMKATELIKNAKPEGIIYETKVIAELDAENKIQWNGGNSLNRAKSYCIKQNEKGMALYALAINPVQEWHFVGKITE